jgi:hypothetical protein
MGVECPTCRDPLWSRNRALENIIQEMGIQICCGVNDCQEMLTGPFVDEHRMTCSRRLFRCPVHNDECEHLLAEELIPHLQTSHAKATTSLHIDKRCYMSVPSWKLTSHTFIVDGGHAVTLTFTPSARKFNDTTSSRLSSRIGVITYSHPCPLRVHVKSVDVVTGDSVRCDCSTALKSYNSSSSKPCLTTSLSNYTRSTLDHIDVVYVGEQLRREELLKKCNIPDVTSKDQPLHQQEIVHVLEVCFTNPEPSPPPPSDVNVNVTPGAGKKTEERHASTRTREA